jgi:hypothetical protein
MRIDSDDLWAEDDARLAEALGGQPRGWSLATGKPMWINDDEEVLELYAAQRRRRRRVAA